MGYAVRTYLSPIGYNSTSVTRTVLSHGLASNDQIVLIRLEEDTDDSRAEEAIGDVRRLLTEVEPEVSLSTERVPHDDFEAAVLHCRDLIRTADGDVTINLGGGARDILLPFMTAALATIEHIDTVLFFSDIDGKVREWQLPRLTATISAPVGETLIAIDAAGGETSIPALTEATDNSKSTVARHVNALETKDAVVSRQEGKTKHISLTLTGRLLLRNR